MCARLPVIILCFQLIGVFTGVSASKVCYSEELGLQSISLRTRLSEGTVLGKDAPERFTEYSLAANFALPWKKYSPDAWGIGSRVMASIGNLRGLGKNSLIVSLVPELVIGSEDGKFTFDFGVGAALFSRYQFGSQDYGGAFQFALTVGLGVPVYEKIGVGYRFQHYSDAALHGEHTVGADFHMVELSYRL